MTATIVGPGGEIDVSDQDDRELGRVTVINTDDFPGSDGLTDAELRASAVSVDTGLDLPDLTGTWSYVAGSAGTENISGRVIGIAAVATGAGATVTIDGGDAVPVPENHGLAIAPVGQLVDPTIVFTGTASYFVEVLD